MQVRWLMGAPAGLKLHAELSALLGGAMLGGLHWAAALAARLAPLLPWLIGAWPAAARQAATHHMQRGVTPAAASTGAASHAAAVTCCIPAVPLDWRQGSPSAVLS